MSNTLFPAGTFEEEQADRPWSQRDTDRMFDLFFEGASPRRIAHKLHRTPKSVKVRVMKFARNERNMAEEYRPRSRVYRKGKKWTQNDGRMLKPLRARGVSEAAIGRLLARDPESLPGAKPGGFTSNVAQPVDRKSGRKRPTTIKVRMMSDALDLLLAHRFLYYCKASPLLEDREYDKLERETIKGASDEERRVIETVSSDNPEDYPNHVRSLAGYLVFKYRGGGEVVV